MKIAKVLLTTTIEKLGYVGEVVEVSDGYARNYLLPHRLAVEPSEHNMHRYAKAKATHEAELEEREQRALRLRDLLADQTLVFVRKAHDDDKLYGSVRAEDIAARIAEMHGEEIEPSRVRLDRPIEALGPHAVTISLYKETAVELRVRVDKEGVDDEQE
jgi:large subunit ribosomal protein L9